MRNFYAAKSFDKNLMMPVFLSFFSLSFGFMNGAVRVIGRRINRVQLERFGAGGIDHIMECTGRNDHRVAGFDNVLLLFIEDEFGFTNLDAEELVDIRVNLGSDFLSAF